MARLIVCGAINWDISCFVQHLPVPGEEVTIKRIIRVSGGTGANVAVAAARILGAEEVALIGALGRDDIARQQIAALQEEGVIVASIQQIDGVESGQAYIMIDQRGENIIASHLGANARLALTHLRKGEVKRQLRDSRGIVLTDPPLEVAEALIDIAKRQALTALWDPGILIAPHREALLSLTKQVDVLFVNETEAAALFGTSGMNVILRRLKELGFENHVVLKLGARGAVVVEAASGEAIEVPALPLKKMGLKVVSTVGCGDVFAGVFAACYVTGSSLGNSLLMASAAAGVNATRPETRGSPDRATLEEVVSSSWKLGFAIRQRKLS